MDTRDMMKLQSEGEHFLTRWEWDKALSRFEAILKEDPDNPRAQQGKARAEEGKRIEQEIVDLIEQAKDAMERKDFETAVKYLDRAQDLAAQKKMLKHHGTIDHLREEAQNLARWKQRAEQCLQTASQFERAGKLGDAIHELNALLQDMEVNDVTDKLKEEVERLRKERDRLQEGKSREERIQEAKDAFREEDYRRAVELVQELKEQYPDDPYIKRHYRRFSDVWQRLERDLESVEQALNDGELDNAVALLQQLRENFPKNPDWRRLWLKAYMGHAQQEFENGRRLFQERQFEEAHKAFKEASKAFARVQEVFPKHPTAGSYQQEAENLAMVANWAFRAQRDMDRLRWEPAKQHLQSAQAALEGAKAVREKTFSDIKVVLDSMMQHVMEMIDRLQNAQTALEQGRYWLEQKDLEKAEEFLRQGLEDLSGQEHPLREDLLKELGRVTRIKRDVETFMKQAEKADDIEERITLLKKAYDLWPHAPEVADRLATQWLQAARKALDANDSERAAVYCQRVKELSHVSPHLKEQAEHLWQTTECQTRVTALLEEVSEEPTGKDPARYLETYRKYRDKLHKAESLARECPDMMPVVQQRLTEIEPVLSAWERAVPLIMEAQELRANGTWHEAAEKYKEAVEALGARAPRFLIQEHKQIERKAQEIKKKLERAEKAVAEAERLYQEGKEKGLGGIKWDALKNALTKARNILKKKPSNIQPLPPQWADLEERFDRLQTRVNVLRDVRDMEERGEILKAVSKLRAATRQYPEDDVLKRVFTAMQKAYQDVALTRAREMLDEARQALARGDYDLAREKLTEVSSLEVEEASVRRELLALREQVGVWEQIRQSIERAREAKRTNSPQAALEAYREALEKAASVSSGLPANLREKIHELIVLVETPGETPFLAVRENRAKADAIYNGLKSHLGKDEQGRQLILPLQEWYDLSNRWAARQFIASVEALQDHVTMYVSAQNAVRRFPDDPEFQQEAIKALNLILKDLRGSLRKRLTRARDLAKQGNLEDALQEIADAEEKFIQPILEKLGEEFNVILEVDEQLSDLRNMLNDLKNELTRWKKAKGDIKKVIEKMQASVEKGDLTAAEQQYEVAETYIPAVEEEYLSRLLDDERARDLLVEGLLREARTLYKGIKKRKQEQALERLDAVLTEIEARLELEPDVQTIIALEERLSVVAADLERLPQDKIPEYRARHGELLARLRQRRDRLEQLAGLLDQANRAEDINEQIHALEQAAALAEGRKKTEIEAQLARLREHAQKQREIESIWAKARLALERGNYEEALEHFIRLDVLGVQVDTYLKVTRLGLALREAKSLLSTGNIVMAKRRLEHILKEAEGNPQADALQQEVELLLEEINQREEHQRQVEELLRQAQKALQENDLTSAQEALAKVLTLDPNNATAHELQQELEQIQEVKRLLDKAQELYEDEQYDSALDLVEKALEIDPESPDAIALRSRLLAEREAGKALAKALSLAQDQQFAEARKALDEARAKNPNHPRLQEVQREIRNLEEEFQERALRPVRTAIREGRFRDALEKAAQTLKQAGSNEFREDLIRLQQEAVEKWTKRAIQEAQSLLDREDIADQELSAALAELEDLTQVSPPPKSYLKRQIQDLQTALRRRYIENRLKDGRNALQEGNIEKAEIIEGELMKVLEEYPDLPAWIAKEVYTFSDLVQQQKGEVQEERRARIINKLKEQVTKASTPSELQNVRRNIERILREEKGWLKEDPEILNLQQEVEKAIDMYRQTQKIIKEVRKYLNRGAFTRAKRKLEDLDLDEVSPLLADEVERWRKITQSLIEAENLESDDPEAALAIYMSVESEAPALSAGLKPFIERCKGLLFRRAIEQVSLILDQPVPNYREAVQLLKAVEEKQWITSSSQQHEWKEWWSRVQGLERVEQVSKALLDEQDPDKALRLLDEISAQDLSIPDKLKRGWASLAQAMKSLHESRPHEAQQWLQEVPEDWRHNPRIRGLINTLQQKAQVLEEIIKYLDGVDRTVKEALNTRPADYEKAIAALQEATQRVESSHPRLRALVEEVAGRLREEVASLRKRRAYKDMQPLFRYLRALSADPGEIDALEKEIEQERQRLLDETLKKVDAYIKEWELSNAEVELREAETLATEEERSEINRRWEILRQREKERIHVQEYLESVRTALRSSDFSGAVEGALKAYHLAPEAPDVRDMIADLKSKLRQAIQVARGSGRYRDALDMCDLALRFGVDEQFVRLRRDIASELEEVTSAAQREAAQALTRLDVATAERFVEKGRRADPTDSRFDDLEQMLKRARQVAMKVKRYMEEGWEYLHQRAFEKALESFRKASETMPEFVEAQAWQHYVTNLAEGISSAYGERHESAKAYFVEAAKALLLKGDETLSPLWGDRLRSERRLAVYYATRLADEMEDMIRERANARRAKQRGDAITAREILRSLTERQKLLPDLVKAEMIPPPDFRIDRLDLGTATTAPESLSSAQPWESGRKDMVDVYPPADAQDEDEKEGQEDISPPSSPSSAETQTTQETSSQVDMSYDEELNVEELSKEEHSTPASRRSSSPPITPDQESAQQPQEEEEIEPVSGEGSEGEWATEEKKPEKESRQADEELFDISYDAIFGGLSLQDYDEEEEEHP